MLVPVNPNIDVGRLLEHVREELTHARRRDIKSAGVVGSLSASRLTSLQQHLDEVHVRSQPRTGLPEWLVKRLPFLKIRFLTRLIIRIHNVLSYDQRRANEAISNALKTLAAELASQQRQREDELNILRDELLDTVDRQIRQALAAEGTGGRMVSDAVRVEASETVSDILQRFASHHNGTGGPADDLFVKRAAQPAEVPTYAS